MDTDKDKPALTSASQPVPPAHKPTPETEPYHKSNDDAEAYEAGATGAVDAQTVSEGDSASGEMKRQLEQGDMTAPEKNLSSRNSSGNP